MIKIKDIKAIAFLKNLGKAYSEGVYVDNATNRKLGRVGMSYKEWSQKQQQGDTGDTEKQQQELKKRKENLNISSINYEGPFSSKEKEKIQDIIFKTCKDSICNLDGSDKPISDKQLLEVLNDDDVVINISKEEDGEVSVEVGGLSLNRAAQARDLEFSGANWLNEDISKNVDKELKEKKKESNNSKKIDEKNTIFDKNSDFSDINAINSLQKSLKSIIGGRMFDLVIQAKCLSIKDGKIICNSDENLGKKIENLGKETEYYYTLSDNGMSKFDDKANVVGSLLNFLNGKNIEDNVLNNLTFKEFESAREKVKKLYRNDVEIKLKNTLIDRAPNPKFLEQINLTNRWDFVLKSELAMYKNKDGEYIKLGLVNQRYLFDKNIDDNEAIDFVKKNIEKMGGEFKSYKVSDYGDRRKILMFDLEMPIESLDLPSYTKYERKKIGEILNNSKEQVLEKQNPFKI